MNNITSHKIYRHESNKGSVIEFTDVFGDVHHLFVADAAFRGKWQFCWAVACIDSLKPAQFDAKTVGAAEDDARAPLSYNLSDLEIAKLFRNVGKDSIKENIFYSSYANHWDAGYRAGWVSVKGIKDRLDVPTLPELTMIYLEADNIDALDPTTNEHPELMLGCKNPTGRFSKDGAWSRVKGKLHDLSHWEDGWGERFAAEYTMYKIFGNGEIRAEGHREWGLGIPVAVID